MRKGKLEGKGVEKKKKKSDKNEGGKGADVVYVRCCALRLFITSILRSSRVHLRCACNDKCGVMKAFESHV